ncbi:thiamine-binding protein, partial [Glutamicibacter protophormiae]|uniref:thiamine-binding protein n=1 Tax=Glutamicibacter protophormiae TaxID=37930 RepID=UPI0033253F96
EGSWDEVFDVVKRATEAVAPFGSRISLVIKARVQPVQAVHVQPVQAARVQQAQAHRVRAAPLPPRA